MAIAELVGVDRYTRLETGNCDLDMAEMGRKISQVTAFVAYERSMWIMTEKLVEGDSRLYLEKTAVLMFLQYAEEAKWIAEDLVSALIVSKRGFPPDSLPEREEKRKRAAVCVTGQMRHADWIWGVNHKFLRC